MTGLTRDVLRVWERRYRLLQPKRGANRYRTYSDEDVLLLRYLKRELDAGGSIGELATLGRAELLKRAGAEVASAPSVDQAFAGLLRDLVATVQPFDRVTFERRLNKAVTLGPFEEALHGILLPLQVQVGELWHAGQLTVAVEHYVTKHVQQKIFSAMNQLPVMEFGSKVIVACPPGEEHDIGALAVAYHCRLRGCRVHFLGANVPVASLAQFCGQVTPDLTLMSVPIALPDAHAQALVDSLSHDVVPISRLASGGEGARAMRELLAGSPIALLEDFQELDHALDRIAHGSGL